MNLTILRKNLTRQTHFAFTCNRCLSCCRHKKIQVNPYEIARLARNRGLNTTQFAARYTHEGGTLLRWDEDGTCVFLDTGGCSVHPDRPLVCRLYPLGRHLRSLGEESFSEIEPDPACKGAYGQDREIVDYLREQDALPFMEAADRYLLLFLKLFLLLRGNTEEPAEREAIDGVLRQYSEGQPGENCFPMDVDNSVQDWCRETGLPFPDNLEEKMSFHIMAMEAWVKKKKRR